MKPNNWYAIITHGYAPISQKNQIYNSNFRLENEGHYHILCQQIQASHLGVFCKRTYLEETFLPTQLHEVCTKPTSSIPEENGLKN